MGDVAMTVPVLVSLAKQYDVHITLLTSSHFEPMFAEIPQITVFPIQKRERHKGFFGLIRLFFDLRKHAEIDVVADLHDVLRTKILRLLFNCSFIKTVKINKGRFEKNQLIKNGKDKSYPLESTFERYFTVFAHLGFQIKPDFQSIYIEKPSLPPIVKTVVTEKSGNWIGIAPFAKHQGKIYPLDKMEEVILLLSQDTQNKIFLFGNGKKENMIMSQWKVKFPSIIMLPSIATLTDELKLIANLDVMVSMDSANMHLASLVGVPVVSIWGATHYYAGFLGWNQLVENIIQTDLYCRPCSIYGDTPCKRKDYACMNQLDPKSVCQKVMNIISK